MRARQGTDHGVGSGERRPVWSDSRKNPPSLSTTQVGLGAVKLDAAGRPVLPGNSVRYLVAQGERPGQLVLNAVMPGQSVAADALVVTLAPEREADVQRLARVIAGLSA